MRASFGSFRSVGLCIGDGPAEGSESGQSGGEFGRVPLGDLLPPFAKARARSARLGTLVVLNI